METNPSVLRRLFTVDEYHEMVRAGILTEEDRVELLEGEIVRMSPIGCRHAACVKRLNQLLTQRLRGRAIVSVQDPVHLDEHSEPQPDVALLRPDPGFYAATHPTPTDILLVIEVADTSADFDRKEKIPLYGRAGVREAWLVDLAAGAIEIHREPSAEGYRTVVRVVRGQSLSPSAAADVLLRADEILD